MRQGDLIEELRPHIQANFKKSPLLINISGCTGSGKSTWAELLTDSFRKAGFKVLHLSEDDFLQPREYRENLSKEKWEKHENWLRLDLMKEVISNLSRSKSTKYFPYLRITGKFDDQEKVVDPDDVVVFESSICSEMFDVIVLLKVDNTTLLDRKLKRDSTLRSEKMIRKYHEVQWAFWNKYKPNKPDYIIDNNDYENPVLKIP